MSAPRVFVSHSHQDDAFTKRLVADLKAAGADVWVDVVGIDRGDFQERINAALGSCQFLVLVLTPDAIASQWVRMETHAAIGLKVQGQMQDILPVAAKSVDAHTIPPLWTNFHRFDATKDYPRALAELLRGLGLPTPRAEPLPTPPPPTPPSR